MLRPARAWLRLAKLAEERSPAPRLLWMRRPLVVALVFGCMVSLITSGRLTLRLSAPAAVYFSFVPLCEIAGLMAVTSGRRMFSIARTIDLYFAGHAPWLLWLTGFAALWAFVSPVELFNWAHRSRAFDLTAAIAAAWSAYIDFWFFRNVLRKSHARAACSLVLQRLICWPAALFCFLASSGWQVASTRLGL